MSAILDPPSARSRAEVEARMSAMIDALGPVAATQGLALMAELAIQKLAPLDPARATATASQILSILRTEQAAREQHVRPLWRSVVAEVALRHGVSLDALLSRRRTEKLAWARFEAWWMLRQVLRANGSPVWSLPQIGRMFGRDHSTVVAGLARYRARLLESVPEAA